MIVPWRHSHLRRALVPLAVLLVTTACGRSPQQVVLTADMPLHLEDHLDAATFTELPAAEVAKGERKTPVEWRFDQPQPDWKATPLGTPPYGAPTLARTGDGLRITLTDRMKIANGSLRGFIRVDVPDWNRTDWAEVVVRARADPSSSVDFLRLAFNLRDPGDATAPSAAPFQFGGEQSPVLRDGTIRTYRFGINVGGGIFQGPWRQLILVFGSAGRPGSIDVLSVTVVPKGAVPAPTTVEWRFDQPQPDWQPILPNRTVNAAGSGRAGGLGRAGGPGRAGGRGRAMQAILPNRPVNAALKAAELERTPDALRVTLPEGSRRPDKLLHGGIYVDLPGWRREEWAHIVVRARTSSVTTMMIGLNPRQGVVPANATQATFARNGGSTPIVSDGSVQTYQIRPDWGNTRTGPWVRVGLDFRASEPGSIEILSVSVVPIDALYAGERALRTRVQQLELDEAVYDVVHDRAAE